MQSAATTEETSTQTTPASAARFPRAFAFVIAMQFVFGLAVATFTILPSVVVRHLGGREDDVGPYSGMLALGALVAAPIAGLLLDRIGRRTVIALGGGSAAAAITVFAIHMDTRPIALPAVFVVGCTLTLVVNGVSALVADLAPEAALARAVGWQGAASMIAGAISPTVAEKLAPRFGWHAPFFVAAGLGLLLVAMAAVLPPDPARAAARAEDPASPGSALRALAPLLVASLLVGASFTTIATYHQPHLIARGASSLRDYFIGFSTGALVMRLGFGSLPDRLGLARATRVALVGYACASLAFTFMTPRFLMLGGLAHGLVHGVFYPSMVALAFRTVGPSSRGLAASFALGGFNGGSALAAFGLGELARATSTSWVFVVGAGCSALALAFIRDPVRVRSTS